MAGTSAFSARPSSLGAPVPGKQAELDVNKMFEEAHGSPPVPATSPAPISAAQDANVDSMFNNAQGTDQNSFPVQEPSSTLGINTDLKQQLIDMPTRIAANIAGDPASVKLTLENKLGKENVRLKGKTLYFKQPGDKAFRELDPTTFEVINDLFSDFAKEYIQGIGGTIGGIAAGASSGGIGIAGGAALGVAGATAAVDAYGSATGVKKDQSQFSTKEPTNVTEQLARGLENTGKDIAAGIEYEAANKIFKGLASKWAERRAKTEGLRKLEEIAPMDRLQESVKQNMETLQEMRQLGLTNKIPGTDVDIPAHQLLPYLPEVQKAANSVGAEKSFQQAQKEAAENFGAAALNLTEEASSIAKGKLSAAIQTGVPGAKGTSASEINGLFNSVRRQEGKVIGEFRDKVRSEMRGAPLPSPNTQKALGEILQNLGINPSNETGKLIFPKDESLMQILGTDSTAFVNGLKSDISRLYKNMDYGHGINGLTIGDMLGESQILGAKNEGARRIGGLYKSTIGKLSSAMRTDSREAMAQVLSPDDAIEYAAKMKRFSSISQSMDQLDNFLRDDIGMNTFARGLVNKGKEGLANLKAAKEFMLQENPEMYRSLIGQYMEELALKHRNPKEVAGFNPAAMKKELLGLGGEYLDELFPARGPISKGLVLRSFDLADQVQRSIVNGSDSELIKDARKTVGSLSAWHRGVNATMGLMRFTSKNGRLLKLLSREGVESFLADTPKNNRDGMRQTLTGILNLARQNGTLAAINPGGSLPEISKDVSSEIQSTFSSP